MLVTTQPSPGKLVERLYFVKVLNRRDYVFSGKGRRNFSAVETAWRREWDSNLALNPKLLITDFKRLAQSA
jgi:hypothetical protein